MRCDASRCQLPSSQLCSVSMSIRVPALRRACRFAQRTEALSDFAESLSPQIQSPESRVQRHQPPAPGLPFAPPHHALGSLCSSSALPRGAPLAAAPRMSPTVRDDSPAARLARAESVRERLRTRSAWSDCEVEDAVRTQLEQELFEVQRQVHALRPPTRQAREAFLAEPSGFGAWEARQNPRCCLVQLSVAQRDVMPCPCGQRQCQPVHCCRLPGALDGAAASASELLREADVPIGWRLAEQLVKGYALESWGVTAVDLVGERCCRHAKDVVRSVRLSAAAEARVEAAERRAAEERATQSGAIDAPTCAICGADDAGSRRSGRGGLEQRGDVHVCARKKKGGSKSKRSCRQLWEAKLAMPPPSPAPTEGGDSGGTPPLSSPTEKAETETVVAPRRYVPVLHRAVRRDGRRGVCVFQHGATWQRCAGVGRRCGGQSGGA